MDEFLLILQQNRKSILKTKKIKESYVEIKAAIDQLHLSLQNYNYECQYTMKEIENCESQDTNYQDIPLCSEEDYFEKTGTLKNDDIDEHLLMKSRLEFELEERRRLTLGLNGLKEQKKELKNTLKKKELELENLEKDINQVLQSTFPFQEKYGLHLPTAARNLDDTVLPNQETNA